MTVPFLDLKVQHKSIKEEIRAAIDSVFDSCQFILGDEVSAFEQEFATFCGARFGVGVSSGTSALHLGLLAAGVRPGDEVITVPFTFVATVAAILYAGGKPVFVDIDPRTYTLDVTQLERAITPKTKAIVPVHLYGQPADMGSIMRIARKHGLVVIEDAAQAHGAGIDGTRAGVFGDIGCFSFYPAKNLGACGDGGMAVTNDPDLAQVLRLLRDWGGEKKYEHIIKGYNNRLGAIQGAVLRVKLRYLPEWIKRRRDAAQRYDKLLQAHGLPGPVIRPGADHVFHLYVVRVRNRSEVQAALHAKAVQTGIHYPSPVHLLPAYSDLDYAAGDFPHSERAAAEVLSLPIFPEITAKVQEQVISALIQTCCLVEEPGNAIACV